jgi:hypothetical protein
VTEEHPTYGQADSAEASEGVEPIGDILRRLIKERGWPLAVGSAQPNGDSPRGDARSPGA